MATYFQRTLSKELKKLTYVSPSTTTAAAIDEIVHSIIMKYNGYTVLKNILKEELKSIPPDSETIDYMFERYEYYCDSDETFHINVEKIDTVSDEAVRLTEENYVFTFPLRGVLSILIYLSGMLGAVLYLSDKRKQIFDAHTPEFTIFSRQAYVLIPVTIFILVSLITLVFSQNAYLPAKEILLMLRYILVILLFTNLCTVLVKDPAMLIPILVVQVIGSLVFCPIFIDIGSAFPVMKIMSYLFVSGYYL